MGEILELDCIFSRSVQYVEGTNIMKTQLSPATTPFLSPPLFRLMCICSLLKSYPLQWLYYCERFSEEVLSRSFKLDCFIIIFLALYRDLNPHSFYFTKFSRKKRRKREPKQGLHAKPSALVSYLQKYIFDNSIKIFIDNW